MRTFARRQYSDMRFHKVALRLFKRGKNSMKNFTYIAHGEKVISGFQCQRRAESTI